jgi:serine/threonine protein kinase
MVTRYGKELVLIDFGKSKKVTQANRFVISDLKEADYSQNETLEKMYQYGTLGYAAPECYAKAANGSSHPFAHPVKQGELSMESDIFSFGATFWECFHIFELVTKSELFSQDAHDFYRQHFLNDITYCNRNLSCTSLFYHKKIDNILKKCTRKRTENHTDENNKDFYHSYKALRKELDNAKNSAPTIVKDENVKVKNAFRLCGSMFAFSATFLVLFFIYRLMGFNIAEEKWNSLTVNYNDTQFYKLEMTATDMMNTASANKVSGTYKKIAAFTYENNDISDYEATMLIDLLQGFNQKKALPERVDEIMQHANTRKFKEISTELMKLNIEGKCSGYELAKAIYNVEVGKTEVMAAYKVLQKYQENKEFHNAVVKLKNVLDNDGYIQTIAEKEKISRPEVQEFFKSIGSFQEGGV